MFNKDSFPLIESRTLRGRQGINLSVHTCRSNSLFFFLYFLFLFFSFYLSFSSLFSMLVFYSVVFLLRSYYPPSSSLVHGQGPLFYSACYDKILLFQPLTTFIWSGCAYRPPLVHLCWLCHSYYQTVRTILFVCLLWHPYLLQCRYFLSIPHCMHLVVPTYPCFFQAVCHPSRTFLPKELEQEPQNRFFPSPHRQTMLSYL